MKTRQSTTVAMVAAVFAAMTLALPERATGDQDPAGCTSNGPGLSITGFPSPAEHGDEVCFKVGIFNLCPGCCNVTGFDVDLTLPDGSMVTITSNATVNVSDAFECPSADPRCVTDSNCTIPGEDGYRYIVNHGDEQGAPSAVCPPVPPAGSGIVEALRKVSGRRTRIPIPSAPTAKPFRSWSPTPAVSRVTRRSARDARIA